MCALLVEMLNGTATMENTMTVPEKIKILPYDSAIPFLGIDTKELKTGTQTAICTSRFIAVMFKITKR